MNRSWVEIDLNALKNNYKIYAQMLKQGQKIMAVVKANAYGHGIIGVAKSLCEIGCSSFAVSNVEEGKLLRKSGIDGKILILGYTPPNCFKDVEKYGLIQTVYSKDFAQLVLLSGANFKVHLAIDTGMRRLGFCGDFETILKEVNFYGNRFKVDGVFTHLSSADESSKDFYSQKQITEFRKVVESLEFKSNEIHFANSAGFLRLNQDFANVVRLGVCLYGLGDNLPSGVFPVLKWKSVVSMVKEVKKGEFIGYGMTFKAKEDMLIATVPIGYADGLDRRLSNKGWVFIKGEKARILGMVCMDQFMIDVSKIGKVNLGDEVEIIGDNQTVLDMAKQIETIGYEVVCKISNRVERIYLNNA